MADYKKPLPQSDPITAPYWESLKERYDTIINLCKSVEGGLLQIGGRMGYGYPQPVRHALHGHIDYLAPMHDIAQVEHRFSPRFT